MDDCTPETPLKKCTRCQQAFPPTVEYFKKCSKAKNGIAQPCRNCIKIERQTPEYKAKKLINDRKYYSRPDVQERERKRKSSPEYKEKEKRHKSSPEYRERDRARDRVRRSTPAYKERIKNYTQRPDIKEREHNRNTSPEGREYKRNHQRKRRQNPTVVEQEREYRKSPEAREIYRVHVRRRRARKANLPDIFTPQDWQRAIEYFDGKCAVCERPPGLWHTLAADHWIPITKDGATIPQNIIPLCQGQGGCNNSKSNRDAEEWLIRSFGKRKAKQVLKRIQNYFDSL